MGAVYLATDSQLGRKVALKIPFYDATDSPQRAERFVREAQSAAALQHPNICTVHDAGRISGTPFITMAYIAGSPLDRTIDPDSPMPQTRAAEIARKVALALGHAHSKGIVHRDLKPANVMMDESGEPVVMDFGLAKREANVDANEAKLTRDGGVLGTPSYMSPEQVRGDADIGPATDVYSLGVVLFEMLTGQTPYSGGIGMVMGRILAAPVPPLAELRPDADPRLNAICQTAMAKSAEFRFPNMTAFAQALDNYLNAVATPTVSVELVEPVARMRPVTVVAPFASLMSTEVATPRRPIKRKAAVTKGSWDARRIGIVAGIALAALVPLVWLAIYVLRVETPNGTLVVEIADEDVEAKIKGGKLVLSGPDGKVRYTLTAGERDKKLDAGAYTIRVEGADGLTLDTPEFTLKKGDQVTVRVTLEKKKLVKKHPEPLPTSVDDPRRDTIPVEALKLAGDGDPQKAPASLVGVIGQVEQAKSYGLFAVAVHPDGKVVYSSDDAGGLRRATLDRPGENTVLRKAATPINIIRWSPDGKVVTDATDTKFAIRDLATGKALFSADIWGVQTLTYSSDGQTLAGSDAAGIVHLWDVKLGKEVHVFPYIGRVNALAFSEDGKTLSAVSYERNCVKVWNVASGAEVSVWKDALQNVVPLALRGAVFSADLRLLATGHADGTITLWDVIKRQKKWTWSGHKGEARTLKFTPDSRTLVSAGGDGVIRVWGIDQERPKEVIPLGPANQMLTFDIDPTGKYIYAAGKTPLIFILRLPEVQAPTDPDPKPVVPQKSDTGLPEGAIKEGAFTPLFNGKDLTGWKTQDGGKLSAWQAKDGVLLGSADKASWLLTEKEYGNYELRLEFKLSARGNSGVALRSKLNDGTAKEVEFEIQLLDDEWYLANLKGVKQDQLTGALYGIVPPTRAASKPIGEWNTMRIVAAGRTVEIELNGVAILGANLETHSSKFKEFPGLLRTSGHVALQGSATPVEFRNIEIKELLKSDPFQEKSVWINTGTIRQVLTVTERKGETFQARFEVGIGIIRDVSGTVKDGKVSWLAKDVKAVKNGVGGDNVGLIITDNDGDRIEFTWQQGKESGAFVLRRQPDKK